MWTYRALERAGYRVIPDGGSEPCVEVIRDSNSTAWRIYGRTGTYSSIESLLADLALHQTEASKEVDRG